MIHITLALGLVIGGIIYSIIFSVALKTFSLTGLQPSDIQTAKQIAAGGYLPGAAVAYYYLKKISLKTRLPAKIPAYPLLVIGVWFTLIRLTVDSIVILKVSLVYLLAILSSIAVPESIEIIFDYVSTPINTIFSAFYLIALLIIFLECKPKKNLRHDE